MILCTAQCFGGVETYEKTAGVAFTSVSNLQGLVSQPGTAVTRDCAALCKQTATCAAFTVGLCTIIFFFVIVCEITMKSSHHEEVINAQYFRFRLFDISLSVH